jgi:hypothetical protein
VVLASLPDDLLCTQTCSRFRAESLRCRNKQAMTQT